MKAIILILGFLSLTNSNAMVFNTELSDMAAESCASVVGDELGLTIGCLATSSSTTIPSILIDSDEVEVDSDVILSRAISERHARESEALASQKIAIHLELTIEQVQDAVLYLYDYSEVTLDNIIDYYEPLRIGNE